MNGLLWVVRKDLARFAADRQGAFMSVLVPVVLAAFLGMLFAPRPSAGSLDLLVVDEDGSPATQALVVAVRGEETFAVEEVDLATARARLEAGDADVALRIPAGAGQDLRPTSMFTGQQGTLELLHDPSDETEADIAEGLLTQVVMQHLMGSLGDRDAVGAMFDELVADLPADADPALRGFLESGAALDAASPAGAEAGAAEPAAGAAGGMQAPVRFTRTQVTASGPAAGYDSYAHNFAGTLLLFLLFGAQSTARNLVAEREEGALLRVRLAPVSPATALFGTAVGAALVALLVSAAVYAVGMLLFGVQVRGSWPGFLAVVLAQAAFVGGFALLLAGLGRTEAQISSVGTFVVLVMSFAGGAMFPSFMMPPWLQAAGRLLPTWWATRGLAAMTWRGLPLSAALPSVAVLLGFAILFGAIGARRFRWS